MNDVLERIQLKSRKDIWSFNVRCRRTDVLKNFELILSCVWDYDEKIMINENE